MSHEENQIQREVYTGSLPAGVRVAIAILLPATGALFVSVMAGGSSPTGANNSQSAVALLLGPVGVISWFLGLRWYGLPGMGLRGRRPLFAGIGFAVLGWAAFLGFRLLVESEGLGTGFRDFIFLLLFEAFAVQLWVFGLIFRGLADWRGPLTAAISSGIIFGTLAIFLFQQPFIPIISGFLYFMLWGILYGVIRLRTGSILGGVIVQTMQSFTGWIVLIPVAQPADSQLRTLYLGAGLCYLIIIWRLWPKLEEDYRV